MYKSGDVLPQSKLPKINLGEKMILRPFSPGENVP